MRNPFSNSKKNQQEQAKALSEVPEHLSIKDLEKRTAAIEAEREEKRIAREERFFHKNQAGKRKRIERWLAPLLLLITLMLSFLLYWRGK